MVYVSATTSKKVYYYFVIIHVSCLIQYWFFIAQETSDGCSSGNDRGSEIPAENSEMWVHTFGTIAASKLLYRVPFWSLSPDYE